jgi:predicted pyridoxine 5'-phosphate oxidase superfamily flavin-nucleotide-binding protein
MKDVHLPVRWATFRDEAPHLAERAEQLLAATGVVLVGTIRADGSPRISPVESVITGGDLWLGMMPGSLKATDLSRDPRCTVHTVITDRFGNPGEFKAHGVARIVTSPADYARYATALESQIGFDPGTTGYPLFVVEVATAALFETGDASRSVTRWRAGSTVENFEQGG